MKNARLYAWILIIVVALGAAGISALRYYKFGDYWVTANVECDPALESCFVGDGEDYPESYKTVHKKAYSIPACNAWGDECLPLSCEQEGDSCYEVHCDVASGDECVEAIEEE